MGKFFDAVSKSEREVPVKEKNRTKLKEKPAEDYDEAFDDGKETRPDEWQVDERIIAYHGGQSIGAQQFRLLRSSLVFQAEGSIPRTIMVTSSEPNDGKSFVAANLAVTYANTLDSHVVLVDCDLRAPTVHGLFGFKDNCKGLSEWLREKVDLEDVLYKSTSQLKKLTVIPAGSPVDNPSELISSQKMEKLLSELKERYEDRYVIIDSPPPFLAAETFALSTMVDGVLIVVRHEKTGRKALKKMVDSMDRNKILGVTLNQYRVRTDKYYGYGKYESNYYYQK